MNTTLRDALGLLVTALVGSIACGLFIYVLVFLIGVRQGSLDESILLIEGTAVLMSAILLSGTLYHGLARNRSEAESVRCLMGWRIHLLHLVTAGMIAADVLV